jgi:tetratricopeptide (TPR) repeat protein
MGLAVSDYNNFDKAVLFFRKAIEYKPEYIDAYIQLAINLNKLRGLRKLSQLVMRRSELRPGM